MVLFSRRIMSSNFTICLFAQFIILSSINDLFTFRLFVFILVGKRILTIFKVFMIKFDYQEYSAHFFEVALCHDLLIQCFHKRLSSSKVLPCPLDKVYMLPFLPTGFSFRAQLQKYNFKIVVMSSYKSERSSSFMVLVLG